MGDEMEDHRSAAVIERCRHQNPAWKALCGSKFKPDAAPARTSNREGQARDTMQALRQIQHEASVSHIAQIIESGSDSRVASRGLGYRYGDVHGAPTQFTPRVVE